MTRIYTRGGDAGQTSLGDGNRVSKDSERVAATGDLDELSAHIGQARTCLPRDAADLDEELAKLQRDLLGLGALLSNPSRDHEDVPALTASLSPDPQRIEEMEARIDGFEAELPPLTAFILAGGSPCSSCLHLARAVARRAERAVVSLRAGGEGHPFVVQYLNRLSDFLFVVARLANLRAGVADELWRP